jgi:hypothetical protein
MNCVGHSLAATATYMLIIKYPSRSNQSCDLILITFGRDAMRAVERRPGANRRGGPVGPVEYLGCNANDHGSPIK